MKRIYELNVCKPAEELLDMVWHDFDKKHEGQISIFYFQCSVNTILNINLDKNIYYCVIEQNALWAD